MPKAIDVIVECPFYKGEGKDYIACEGVINGTVDKHFFKNIKEKGMFENNVCSSDCTVFKSTENTIKFCPIEQFIKQLRNRQMPSLLPQPGQHLNKGRCLFRFSGTKRIVNRTVLSVCP